MEEDFWQGKRPKGLDVKGLPLKFKLKLDVGYKGDVIGKLDPLLSVFRNMPEVKWREKGIV